MAKKKKAKHDFKVKTYHVNSEVTGSAFLIQVDDTNILLDMGGFQSSVHDMRSVYNINAKKFAIPMEELDFVIVREAHYDHSAMLPILAQESSKFNGTVITTEPSLKLIKLNLHDSAFVQSQECKAYNKKNPNKPLYPLYNDQDVEKLLTMLRGYGYNEKIRLTDKIHIEFIANGHLYGSASLLITYQKDAHTQKTLYYSGDTNYCSKDHKPFTLTDDQRKVKPNVLIMESTYGNRFHQYEDTVELLANHIREQCIKRKRKLIIPAFAISRSTQLVYYLKEAHKRYPDINEANIPILFTGKMANTSHNIIGNEEFKHYVDEKWHDAYDIFKWGRVKKIDSFDVLESEIAKKEPSIVITSSGMMSQGWAAYIGEQLLPQYNTAFLMSGYVGIGTVGRAVLDTREKKKKQCTIQGKTVKVNATILEPLSLSGHGDRKQLLKLVRDTDHAKLQCVILVHGDKEAKESLKEAIEQELGYNWLTFDNGKKKVLIPKTNEIIKI